MGGRLLSACLLFGLVATVLSQTTGGPTPEPWSEPTGSVWCYSCDNEPDNDACNGHDGTPATINGSLIECTRDDYALPSCLHVTKYNIRGNGWSLQKGCIDWDLCNEMFYGQMDDPFTMSCFHAWYFNNPPPIPGVECITCCEHWGEWNDNQCNGFGYFDEHRTWVNNNVNLWDHALDSWPGHEISV